MAYRPIDRVFTPAANTTLVVTLSEMRDHLRIDSTAEDALIEAYLGAAVATVERWTQRLLVRRQAVLRLTDLPSDFTPIELPGGEVGSVTSVIVDIVTITGTYAVGHSPAVLIPATSWPTVTGDGYPVTITYQVGFATVPGDLTAAVRLIAAELFERRTNAEAVPINTVPMSAEYLMMPHRIRAVA